MKSINYFLFAVSVAVMLLMSCNNDSPKEEAVEPEIESNSPVLLKKGLKLEENQLSVEAPKPAATDAAIPEPSKADEKKSDKLTPARLAGKHALTIQWISWEKPGEITFTSIGDNKYEVEGSQRGEDSGECPDCYLKIKGVVTEITPKKLEFTGSINSSIYHIQNGEVCTKEGTFDFLSTKNRKYWRCQNMDGCEGVTDYVDIYF
jgi:hypothetical protein